LSPSTVRGLHIRWIKSGVFSPTVAHGLLYVADGAELLALDPQSGALQWQGTPTYYGPGPPVYDAGRVYATSYGPELYAFDARTGTLLWDSTGFAYGFTAPTIMRRSAYVDGEDGNTFAFDGVTGQELWHTLTNASTLPAAANGRVFVARYPITALNATTGKIVWTSRSTPARVACRGGWHPVRH